MSETEDSDTGQVMDPITSIATAIGNFFGWKKSANEAIDEKQEIKELRYSKLAIMECVKLFQEIEQYVPKEYKKKFLYRKRRFFKYIAKD